MISWRFAARAAPGNTAYADPASRRRHRPFTARNVTTRSRFTSSRGARRNRATARLLVPDSRRPRLRLDLMTPEKRQPPRRFTEFLLSEFCYKKCQK
jgi:hypothetical protein